MLDSGESSSDDMPPSLYDIDFPIWGDTETETGSSSSDSVASTSSDLEDPPGLSAPKDSSDDDSSIGDHQPRRWPRPTFGLSSRRNGAQEPDQDSLPSLRQPLDDSSVSSDSSSDDSGDQEMDLHLAIDEDGDAYALTKPVVTEEDTDEDMPDLVPPDDDDTVLSSDSNQVELTSTKSQNRDWGKQAI